MDAVLLILLSLQDPAAEAVFNRIEAAVESAESLSVRVRCEGSHTTGGGKPAVYEVSGHLLIRRGKGISRSLVIQERGNEVEKYLLSDGVRIHIGSNRSQPAPKKLEASLIAAIPRAGIVYPALIGIGLDDKVGAVRWEYPLSTFSFGPEENGLKCIRYQMKVQQYDLDAEGEVWFDPKTFKIAKRTLTIGNAASTETIRETYTRFSVNIDIPAEKFKVNPAESLEAAIKEAKTSLAEIRVALGIYEIDIGEYPNSLQGLQALLVGPQGVKNWKGPYLERAQLPTDPWGKPYLYNSPGTKNPAGYDLGSLGPDGTWGTPDDVLP